MLGEIQVKAYIVCLAWRTVCVVCLSFNLLVAGRKQHTCGGVLCWMVRGLQVALPEGETLSINEDFFEFPFVEVCFSFQGAQL